MSGPADFRARGPIVPSLHLQGVAANRKNRYLTPSDIPRPRHFFISAFFSSPHLQGGFAANGKNPYVALRLGDLVPPAVRRYAGLP